MLNQGTTRSACADIKTCIVASAVSADLWGVWRHGSSILGVSVVGVPVPAHLAGGDPGSVLQSRCPQFGIFGVGEDYLCKVWFRLAVSRELPLFAF